MLVSNVDGGGIEVQNSEKCTHHHTAWTQDNQDDCHSEDDH